MHIPYKKQIFPIHIFQTHIKENELLKDELFSKIQEICKDKDIPIPAGWQTSKLITTFDNDDINNALFNSNSLINKVYPHYLNKFFDKPVDYTLTDIWFNYYDDGEYQEKHSHIAPFTYRPSITHFSVIHYLKFDSEVHQPTVFVDPLEMLRLSSLEMESNYYNHLYYPRVKEGSLLMFPSYMEHMVKKSEPTPNNPRITIAMNIRVNQYGEEDKSNGN